MTLLELKLSLAKLSPDMNDMQMVIIYADGDKRKYESLCFTAYIPLKGNECVALGTMTEVQRMVKAGEIEKPTNYIEPEDDEE